MQLAVSTCSLCYHGHVLHHRECEMLGVQCSCGLSTDVVITDSMPCMQAPERMVNMNAAAAAGDDDHVTFFARNLVPSPCGRFLLVSTDTGRMIMMRLSTWKLCRFMLYSLPTEQFHQFCAAWHRDSHYVFAGAAGAQVRHSWSCHLYVHSQHGLIAMDHRLDQCIMFQAFQPGMRNL